MKHYVDVEIKEVKDLNKLVKHNLIYGYKIVSRQYDHDIIEIAIKGDYKITDTIGDFITNIDIPKRIRVFAVVWNMFQTLKIVPYEEFLTDQIAN